MTRIKNAMVASIGLMFAVAVTGCTATGDSGVDGDPVTNVDATESVGAADTAAPSESAEPEESEEPSATTGPAESEDADGCDVLSQGDAPFGAYCGAGIELPVPDENLAGSDFPDEDRI